MITREGEERMSRFRFLRVVIASAVPFLSACTEQPAACTVGCQVLQYHVSGTRTGLYVDPLLTKAAVATTHRDTTFSAVLPGPTYAQPLYVASGPGSKATLIAVTEQNVVVAIDASSGAQLWTSTIGAPVPVAQLPCGDIDPLGITGTPVVDTTARAIYVAAMTTPDGGVTKQHRVFALSLDDGSTLAGWPLDVNGITTPGGAQTFASTVQNQRGALLLNSGTLYVPYGGHAGDCGAYHGWVVAVPVVHPAAATAWATTARGGAVWAPGGIATDGTSIFAATGNTFAASTWMGGEAVVRLGAGATFSGAPTDFFAPSDWPHLDAGDLDVGGSGPVVIDVPGATPSQLLIALGKNGVAYLLDRNNLGGFGTGDGTLGEGLQSAAVSTGSIINAAASYRTPSGTYVVFNTIGSGSGCPAGPGNVVALKIGATAPPTLSIAWCAEHPGRGSPIVTTTDGTANAVVWTVGAEGNSRLFAFDGDTGTVLFAGGGAAELLGTVRRFQTPIAIHGRIFVAADNELVAFTTE
jgi:hypothetical protein